MHLSKMLQFRFNRTNLLLSFGTIVLGLGAFCLPLGCSLEQNANSRILMPPLQVRYVDGRKNLIIIGRLVDSKGTPLVGLSVSLEISGDIQGSSKTDKTGSFLLKHNVRWAKKLQNSWIIPKYIEYNIVFPAMSIILDEVNGKRMVLSKIENLEVEETNADQSIDLKTIRVQ